ncbi:uncharacterized protein LOC135200107 isoform X2 [Macrobrachium nipponense]
MHNRQKAAVREPNKSFLDFTKDFREKAKKGIADCQVTKDRGLGAIENLTGRINSASENKKEIDALIEIIQKLKFSNENTLSGTEKDIELLRNRVDAMLQLEEKIQVSDDKLEALTDFTSAGPIIDEAEEALKDIQEKAKDIQEILQKNERERASIQKENRNAKKRLRNIAEKIEQRIIEEDSLIDITVTDLRSPSGPLSGSLHREVVAVKTFKGKQRVALIKLKKQLVLSNFEEGDIPPKSYVIKVESLMHTPSRRAFLDLGVDGTVLGRIIIRVIDEGNLARNFLHMCAGDMGPSYANSRVLSVYFKNEEGENVSMGSYKINGRNSKAAVLPDVDWESEKRMEIYEKTSMKVGELRGWFNNAMASCFYIVTRDYSAEKYGNRFGIVEEGLDILRDAISQHPDVTKIMITDCGLIFSL